MRIWHLMKFKICFLLFFLIAPFSVFGFGFGDGFRQTKPTTGAGAITASSPISLDFVTIAPSTETGKAGGFDEARGTITLSPTTEQGARFGAQLIPSFWDQSSPMALKLYFGTPTGAAVASMVFQLKIQGQGAGNGFFSDSSWLVIGTFTALLSATSTIQIFAPEGFEVPTSKMALDRPIALSINRIGGHANDTHPAQIHILKLRGIINE